MTEPGQFAGEVSAPPTQPAPPTPPPARPGRGWTAMLGMIAALFVILTLASGAVVALGGKNASPPRGTDTPRSAVQSWAGAMEAGDYATADMYFSSALKSTGRTSASNLMALRVTSVVINTTQTNGDSASVSVTIELSSQALAMTSQELFRMVRESGGWKIDEIIEV